jgi:transcriptional regulator of acetoin/glycerol metabolism
MSRQHDRIIKDSWQRCESLGLLTTHNPVIERVSKADSDILSEQYCNLVNTTDSEVLPYYQNILSNAQCLIVLTDDKGIALQSWGDKRFLSPKHQEHFAAGIDWKEKYNGTNAIGTALYCGEAVQIQRDEHFLKCNRFMIGSAAPIYDVNQSLLGMLDISSDSYLPQTHTLGLVKLMSQGIENRLLVSSYSEQNFMLSFNTNMDNIDSQWSGLVVFDANGIIISANRRAESLLSYDLALVNVADIFGISAAILKNQPEQISFAMVALEKYKIYGSIKKPSSMGIYPADFREHGNVQDVNKVIDTTIEILPEQDESDINIAIPLENFGFGDEKINRFIDQSKRVVNKTIPILIHGETGVGKEVFVNGLHHFSERKSYPLVAVNCAAIPNELVESELFGYEKGAFTGANTKGSIGLIRKAHKGTLFLDEIGEMPLNVQGRLLRVLQERSVTPLGSTKTYSVDIKLISATNRSLKAEVEKGNFRQDLYYRVTGLNIELPPLRERTDRRHLFEKINQMHQQSKVKNSLSAEVMDLFHKHPWPGNIRQLVCVLQIAQAMADNGQIQTWHLPDDFFDDIQLDNQSKAGSATVTAEPLSPLKAVEAFETKKMNDIQQMLTTFTHFSGNVSKTAKALDVSRNTLYKRLKEAGVR